MTLKKLMNDMDGLSTTVMIPAGRTLCREGELAREAMLLIEGTAEVTRRGDVIAAIGSGELIGELALDTDDHMRTATVTATSDCTVAVMTPSEFSTLKRRSPTFAELLDVTVQTRS